MNPNVPVFPKMREHRSDLQSATLTPETVRRYDCVVIGTDHDAFDYPMIIGSADLVVNTRGRVERTSSAVVSA